MGGMTRLAPWLAALALLAIDAAKPLVIDDTAYVAYARQIADAPLDPYGFEVFWANAPQRAMDVLSPPVVPYALALAMALFGDAVPAWKLIMLPFVLVLAAACLSLARRVAPDHASAVACLIVLGPAVAPSLNLMLDVPALALGLGAVALFLRALDGGPRWLALAAGLVAGLAIETKYSAATSVAAIAMAGVVFRRPRETVLALAAVALVFLGWEGFVSARYGESHFLHHVFDKQAATAPGSAAGWALGLAGLLGVAGPASAVLAARAGLGRWGAAALTVAWACGWGALALLPALPEARFTLVPDPADVSAELRVLAGLGALVAGAHLPVLVGALRGAEPLGRFLAAWVVIEAVACVVLSPFLALRRVIPLCAVLVLLGAHALGWSGRSIAPRGVARIAGLGALAGLALASIDLVDARARASGFARAVASLRAAEAPLDEGRVWFVGHWGFQFLAEREGMRPLIAGASAVRAGDWLVTPSGVLAQRAGVPAWARSARERIGVTSPAPYSTLPNAYGGAVALRRQPLRQMQILLQRIERNAVAQEPAQP